MEKNKNKYGTTFRNKIENENDEDDEELSPEESEDSEGELDNEIVRDKFINTLLELKDENETKKLIENKTPIFTDEDFKQKRPKIHAKEENEKIEYGIKDALLDNKNNDSENENISTLPSVSQNNNISDRVFNRVIFGYKLILYTYAFHQVSQATLCLLLLLFVNLHTYF